MMEMSGIIIIIIIITIIIIIIIIIITTIKKTIIVGFLLLIFITSHSPGVSVVQRQRQHLLEDGFLQADLPD